MTEDVKETFLIESLKKVAQTIAASLGPWAEVVVHDLRRPESSIVEIVNGHVTGRRVGGSVTDYGLKMLIGKENQDLYLGYSTLSQDGRQLKSSTVLFRDEAGNPIIALCLNLDVTDFVNFAKTCETITSPAGDGDGTEPLETFESDVALTMNGLAEKVIRRVGKATSYMKKADRLEVVRQLEDQGFFLLKGSVKALAEQLRVSSFSIYKYLEEVKADRDQPAEAAPPGAAQTKERRRE